ncbi:MAG: hypothetical protein V1835_04645 [Candidatus Micrarchaeota archaeon]
MKFTGKLIRVGNGLAFSASKKLARENKWKIGQKFELIVLKKNKGAALRRMFGMFPDAAPFVREKKDREFA